MRLNKVDNIIEQLISEGQGMFGGGKASYDPLSYAMHDINNIKDLVAHGADSHEVLASLEALKKNIHMHFR